MTIASFDVGEKNLAFSIGTEDKLHSWYHFNIMKCKRQTITESCDLISNILRDVNWSECTIILIEQQILHNIRAQRISQHIWSWFRLIIPTVDVRFVPSSLKTRYYIGKNNLTPKMRKKWAIVKVKEILLERKDYKNISYLDSAPKQDDLADSYLQLISYVKSEINKTIDR